MRGAKVDFKGKSARLEFDEKLVSAQKVAVAMAETPHMMGEDMHYSGALLLSVAGLKDAANAQKAKDALRTVNGVEKATADPQKGTVALEFSAKGDLTSKQLIEALNQVGLKGANYEPKNGPKTAGPANTPTEHDLGMAMEDSDGDANPSMEHMPGPCPWCAPPRGNHRVRRVGGCCR